MTTEVVNEVKFVSSKSFQDNFAQSEYMDISLASFLSHNKDAPAIVAVRHAAKVSLPYGRWVCRDGSEVIFNREYQPMFKKVDGKQSFVLPDLWVDNIVETQYFYGDHNSPVTYLLRKFKGYSIPTSYSKDCRRSLAVCLKILEDCYPSNVRFGHTWEAFRINK